MSAALASVLSALVGVVHVHHEPSHDSDASFEEVLAAAFATELDFVVLTDHAPWEREGALPGAEHAGVHVGPGGRRVLVLVGVEVGTDDGHLLALDVPSMPRPEGRSGRAVIDAVHALGGFAVVPHPFSHGGWHAWDAPFDGLEVHNNAQAFRSLGLAAPFVLLTSVVAPRAALRFMLPRPRRALVRWESLLRERRVVAFSGADAHQNVSLLGWTLDPYARLLGAVQTVCPDTPLAEEAVWVALRSGGCSIRYAVQAPGVEPGEKLWVRFPSGRRELWVRGGRRVLEIHQAPRPGSGEERGP